MLNRSPALIVLAILSSVMAHTGHERTAHNIHPRQSSSCFPADPLNTLDDRIQAALSASATGFSLQLCQDTQYNITRAITFNAPNQEITTFGFPGPDLIHRAIINVDGPIPAHTTAVDGSCSTCGSVALRYVQINGNRGTGPIVTGGANIEFGNANQNQIVEWVHSRDPRGWSCLHIAEGPLTCANAIIRNNDIGPCGTDKFQEWSDGISLSCKDSSVYNNVVTGATDGGIVIFGSPGSHIYNNTIRAYDNMQLGGINLVDYDPWSGNFTGTIVENNQIFGGFATNLTDPSTEEGKNANDTFIKIGIAMGPRTWFGSRYGMDMNRGATVRNNTFQGAFGYAMAAAVVTNWTVSGNVIDADVTFIGAVGPNCSTSDATPAPAAFVFNSSQITGSIMQQEFVNRDTDSLTCILPDNDDFWPYVPSMTSISPAATGSSVSPATTTDASKADTNSSGKKSSAAPLALGVLFGVLGAAILSCALRTWYMKTRRRKPPMY